MEDQTSYELRGGYKLTKNGKLGAYLFVLSPIVSCLALATLFAPSITGGAALAAALISMLSGIGFLLGFILLLTGRSIELEKRPLLARQEGKRLWS